MKKTNTVITEKNSIEFEVTYSIVKDEDEELVGETEIEIHKVKYMGKNITQFCEAFELFDEIKTLLT
jgi:hypothetical protein